MTTSNGRFEQGAGAALGRQLAVGLLGSAAFGVAAATGQGPLAMAKGAWMGPALFVGGAALAAPPLYMFGALAGSRVAAREAVARTARALAAVATALLGLSAPAAFLSTTLTTQAAPALLSVGCAVAGGAGVVAVARETLRGERRDGPRAAAWQWAAFALALGLRLMGSLASHLQGVA